MEIRAYDQQRDLEGVRRIWRETGWLKEGQEELLDQVLAAGPAFVAELDGQPESAVTTTAGEMRHLHDDLSMQAVTGVTTSRIGRKQGLARRLTPYAIADAGRAGTLLSALGMFEQGYYNQVGYGTLNYASFFTFDPSTLPADLRARPPQRITREHWQAVHSNRLRRERSHGGCNILAAEETKAGMLHIQNGFGLGYFDDAGQITHHVWAGTRDVEHGPYFIAWIAFSTREQFLELMGLVRSLGDQVQRVQMLEPAGVQLQDLLRQPFRQACENFEDDFPAIARSAAIWQVRMLDVPACLERTHLAQGPVQFNLELSDPIEASLDAASPWRGVAGSYVVTLGPSSGADRGHDAALPTLSTTVNAFSRLWLGVRPASRLALTDDVVAPPALLEALDDVVRVPTPTPDWDF